MRHHERLVHPRHINKILILFTINVMAAFVWGPVFITLTAAGPLRHLSSTVVWVAIISYYANCMGNIATAAALYSSMVSHSAREVALDAQSALEQHENVSQPNQEGH